MFSTTQLDNHAGICQPSLHHKLPITIDVWMSQTTLPRKQSLRVRQLVFNCVPVAVRVSGATPDHHVPTAVTRLPRREGQQVKWVHGAGARSGARRDFLWSIKSFLSLLSGLSPPSWHFRGSANITLRPSFSLSNHSASPRPAHLSCSPVATTI